MVNIVKINEFGQELNQLIIDKSDYKHTNRILRLTEKNWKVLTITHILFLLIGLSVNMLQLWN